MRRCSRCNTEKPLEEFPRDPQGSQGRYRYCKPCKAAYMRERNVRLQESGQAAINNLKAALARCNVDMDWYEKRMEACDGCCEVCGGPPTGNHLRLTIDHNHTTGVGRGLLCGLCNVVLGMAMDDPALLRALANYLEREI